MYDGKVDKVRQFFELQNIEVYEDDLKPYLDPTMDQSLLNEGEEKKIAIVIYYHFTILLL